jgi:hypothetical protein
MALAPELSCATAAAPACDGACPPGAACVPYDQRRAALLTASGCDLSREAPLCPGPLSAPVRARLRAIAAGEAAADAPAGPPPCVCMDVAGVPCGLLPAPVCAGECPPEAPVCRATDAGCACLP